MNQKEEIKRVIWLHNGSYISSQQFTCSDGGPETGVGEKGRFQQLLQPC